MPIVPGPLRRWLLPRAQRLEVAPDGWATKLPAGFGGGDFWAHFIARECAACQALMADVRAGTDILPLDADERIKRATFGEALAVAAGGRSRVTLLDIGGNLGDYYWIGKALVPNLEIEFHCLELAAVAAAGREVNPAVTFHSEDDCLDRPYDLIMFSSSLQCLADWRAVLGRAARSAHDYVFLSDVPVVQTAPSFVVVHHLDGRSTLQHQFNRAELLGVVRQAGLSVAREFEMGPHPTIMNAPEQPRCMGWLFQRDCL